MSFLNPCFFCLKSKQHFERMLCENCVQKFSDYKFYCCPRCSKFDCSGCENLSEFNSIFSLYSYNSLISKIIAGAKDKFNIHFQEIFEEIFLKPTQTELEQILLHKNYQWIILSPYRKSRIFHGFWHPNIFFEKIFTELQQKFEFKLLTPHYTTYKATNVYISHMSFVTFPETILLCDDVLTTGASALKSFHALNKYFNKLSRSISTQNDIQTSPHDISWDLFTIFRSPQK